MKNMYLISLLLLAGCANHYSASDGSINSDKLASDTKECNQEATRAYYASQPPVGAGQVAGLVAGGLVGGAIGGAIGGAAFGTAESDNSGVMKLSDINPYVDKCMKERGYNVVAK